MRKIFGLKGRTKLYNQELQGLYSSPNMQLWWTNESWWDGWGMYSKHMGEKINTFHCRWETGRKEAAWKARHRWKNNIETDLKYNARMQNRLNWLRIGTSVRLMWTWQWTLGFHKMQISWLAKGLFRFWRTIFHEVGKADHVVTIFLTTNRCCARKHITYCYWNQKICKRPGLGSILSHLNSMDTLTHFFHLGLILILSVHVDRSHKWSIPVSLNSVCTAPLSHATSELDTDTAKSVKSK